MWSKMFFCFFLLDVTMSYFCVIGRKTRRAITPLETLISFTIRVSMSAITIPSFIRLACAPEACRSFLRSDLGLKQSIWKSEQASVKVYWRIMIRTHLRCNLPHLCVVFFLRNGLFIVLAPLVSCAK